MVNCKLSRNIGRMRGADDSEAARLLRDRPQIEPVVEAIFARLAEENRGTPIFIMMDGPRQRMFADERSQAQLRWLPEMMSRLAKAHGFVFVDLEPRLKSFTARSGKSVSFESDYHWNRAGHQVAADAITEALMASGVTRSRGLSPAQ
jgi:hypothetical protein